MTIKCALIHIYDYLIIIEIFKINGDYMYYTQYVGENISQYPSYIYITIYINDMIQLLYII